MKEARLLTNYTEYSVPRKIVIGGRYGNSSY